MKTKKRLIDGLNSCASCPHVLVSKRYGDNLEPPKIVVSCYYDGSDTWEPKPIKNMYIVPKWCPLENADE